MDSYPQENFTADLSVFQAHFPVSSIVGLLFADKASKVFVLGREVGTIQIPRES